MSVRNKNGFLKRWFIYFLIFNHLATPHLLAAKYHPSHTVPHGDFVDDFRVHPHVAKIHKQFVQPQTAEFKTLQKSSTGSYQLSIDPKENLNQFLIDERQNNEIIGHIISHEKRISFIGVEGCNFEVKNPWDLQSLDVNMGGNLHFLKDVTVHENASLSSNALMFEGAFHANGCVALDAQEDIVNKNSLKSGQQFTAKFNRLENQSSMNSSGNIIFKGKQVCSTNKKSIVKSDQNIFFDIEDNIHNNGLIKSEKSLFLSSNTLLNRENISSKEDLIIKTNDCFNNLGMIEVFGNAQAQYKTFKNLGFTQIQGNFSSQGDSFIGQKNTHFLNNLRVRGIYQASVKNYDDSGANYWDSLAMIQAEHLRLFGKYTCTSAMLNSENGLIIGSEASFQTSHFIGLKSGGTVEFKGEISIPFSKKSMVSQGPAFQELSKLIKKMPHTISIEGKKGIRQNGNIDSKTTSISYSTDGNFQLKGKSSSGVFEFNRIDIQALNAIISGSLISHGDVLARIQKDLNIMGELTAHRLNALAQKIKISGSLHAHNANLEGEENISISSAASLKIQETLNLNAGRYINHEGKTHAKNILAQATSITNKGDITARNMAHFRADRYFANLWGGSICARDINIDTILNLNFLSSLYGSRSITTNSIVDLNFLGIESAHHISSNSFLSLKAGACLPSPSLESIFSWDTLMMGTKATAMAFCPPQARALMNLGFSVYRIYTQLPLLYHRYQNLPEKFRFIDYIPLMVGVKDLSLSAYTAVYDLQSDTPMPKFSIEKIKENSYNAALNAFFPSINQDSLINLNMGLMGSGNIYHRGIYSNNFGSIRARNYTNDVLFATNTGNILGTNISFYNKSFLNKGKISSSKATNIKADNLKTEVGSRIDGEDVVMKGEDVEHEGIADASKSLLIKGKNTTILGKRSRSTAPETDIGQEAGGTHSKRVRIEKGAQIGGKIKKRSRETAMTTDIAQEEGSSPSKRVCIEGEDQLGGNVRIAGDAIELDGINANQNVSDDVEMVHIDSLALQGNHIKMEGLLSVDKNLYVKGERVEQLGTTKSGEGSRIEATREYVDTAESRNESGGTVSLIAKENNGFNGQQVAGNGVFYDLKGMNPLSLLNQTEAPLIQAHLPETDMVLDDDLDVTSSLYLQINRFENNANFSANKAFILQTATETVNRGNMITEEEMELESQGTIANSGLMESATLDVKAPIVINESKVKQIAIPGGYADIIEKPATMRANNGTLDVEGTTVLHGQGGHFEAPEGLANVRSGAEGILDLGSQPLEQDYAYRQTDGHTLAHYHQYQMTHHLTQINAREGVNLWSGTGGTTLHGVAITSANEVVTHDSAGELRESEVHNILKEDTTWQNLHKDKHGEDHTYTATVTLNYFKAGSEKDINLHANENIFLQAPHIEAKFASIKSHNGKVHIDPAISSSWSSSEKFSKNLAWQYQKEWGHYDETAKIAKILAEKVDISGAQGVEIGIKNAGNNQALSLDMLENNAETAWIKELRKDPNVTWHLINEDHEKWRQKVQGLTGPAAAVIGITISVATMGTGAALLAIPAASLPGVMASAGFSTLVSQASVSLINNQGNIGKVFKEMGSKESIKSLATSVASAGITHGLTSQLTVPTNNITRHFQQSLVSSGTSAGLSMLIDGQDVKEALLHAAKNIAVDTVGGVTANKIGSSYAKGKLDWVTHKLAHGALGALTGAILNDDPRAGMIAGALGGVVSEIITEGLLDNAKKTAFDRALAEAKSEGRSLTYQDVEAAVLVEAQKAANLGHLGATFAAFGLGQDVSIANRTATNAVNNNFIPFVMVGLSIASALYSGYEVYQAFQEAGGGDAGAEAALKELAKQGVINLAGGVAGKGATAALKAVLKENPTLRMVFRKGSQRLDSFTGVVESSKATLPTVIQQRVPQPDFSTPEAAFYLQIDPSGKGPKAIDTSFFTSGTKTPNGGIRNRKQFWKLWDEQYPGMMSEKNLTRIHKGRSPYVDSQWVEHFPEHQHYIEQRLEHHHLDHGKFAVPLPKDLHRGEGNKLKWHDK